MDARNRERSPLPKIVLLAVAFAALVGVMMFLRPTDPTDGGGAGGGRAPDLAKTLARERAAAYFATEQQYGRAREELAPLVAGDGAELEDLVRAAAVEYADGRPEAASALLARAEKADPRSPAVLYLRGQIAREAGDYEAALPLLRAAHELAPADLPTRLALAEVEGELGAVDRAVELYGSIVEVGIENGGNNYVSAVYRLARLLTTAGREDEAERYNRIFGELTARGIKQAPSLTINLGTFGVVRPPAPHGTGAGKPGALPAFAAGPAVLPELGGARRLQARDVDGDGAFELVAAGPRGLWIGTLGAEGWSASAAVEHAVDLEELFDVDNDGDLDALVVEGSTIELWTRGDEGWARSSLAFPPLPSAPLDVLAVDYDHEGDIDLAVVGAFGARMWRNDGAAEPEKGGTFADASGDAALPSSGTFAWVASEDFDGDNDVDLLLGGPERLFLADSLRAGRFADATARFPAGTKVETAPLLADLDGDARVDAVASRATAQGALATAVLRQRADGTFAASDRPGDPLPTEEAAAVDLDLDGALDLVLGRAPGEPAAQGVAGVRLAVATPAERAEAVLAGSTSPRGPLAAADLDGDRDVDLAVATADGVVVLSSAGNGLRGVPVSYRGFRDNRRAVGGIVEVRTGTLYRRIYWRGEPVLVGVGGHDRVDVLRITWPNGLVTTSLDLDLSPQEGVDDPDAPFRGIVQPSGQMGSCPFLYAWNGRTYAFVSDVLGITPLGLPIAPGKLVPPDHDEYVLVRGDQLAPKDGELVLQVTEELREVTYLDQARLVAVDHPRGTAVYPNELFCFPPFPEAKIHVVRDALAPARATGSDGLDWTAELARVDDVHAEGFATLPAQFAGMTEPWFLELEFDRAAVRDARALRLVLTGWFFWSDASANMAAARHPGVAFVPPVLQVPDGAGGWRDAGPPVGFPAGKTKTMVLDVGAFLDREDPRIRVFSTLRLYWDAIALAVDAGEEPLRTTTLDARSAELWRRGFSAPLDAVPPGEAHPRNRPERFDWEALAPLPRWDQHPGLYTRYGGCAELVAAVDDRFAIFGAGDALTLRFDASALPPLADGWTRDWLVYLDGWAKDRDPNTIEALEVEPLPFHGMSGYPYGPDERYPDDEAHRSYRETWNTRPAHRWIQPVSPAREQEWLGTR